MRNFSPRIEISLESPSRQHAYRGEQIDFLKSYRFRTCFSIAIRSAKMKDDPSVADKPAYGRIYALSMLMRGTKRRRDECDVE